MPQKAEISLEVSDWIIAFDEGGYRFAITPHGRSAGTTVNYSNFIIKKCQEIPNYNVLILRNFKSTANKSALDTIRSILSQHNIPHRAPLSKDIIYFDDTGAVIECLGFELNVEDLKGQLDKADFIFFEECEGLTEDQWLIIEPTCRKRGSRIALNWNPRTPTEYAWRLYTEPELTYPYKVFAPKILTYRNNPWLPDEVAGQIQRAQLPGQEKLKAEYEGDFPVQGHFFDISKIKKVDGRALDYWKHPETVRFRAWDTAYKKNKSSDYTVGLLLARRGDEYLVEDIFYDRLSPSEIKEMVKVYAKMDQCEYGIECISANESYVDDVLSYTIADGLFGKKLHHLQRSKPERAQYASNIVGQGLLSVPADAPWLAEFLSQLYPFPKDKHPDDMVDGLAYGVEELINYGGDFRLDGAISLSELQEMEKNGERPGRILEELGEMADHGWLF